MEEFDIQMEKVNRLNEITQRIGFALWQMQELEGVSAQYFVLASQAEKGMGEVAGNTLVEEARKKTFGRTIHRISNQGLLSTELKDRFFNLLSERNWLVHRSRADSRDAIHSNKAMQKIVARIDAMEKESLSLLREIGSLSMAYVKKHGVTEQYTNKKAQELLKQWHTSEEI